MKTNKKAKAKQPKINFRPFTFTPGLTAWAPGDIYADAQRYYDALPQITNQEARTISHAYER